MESTVLLTVTDVAARLQVKEETVREWLRTGRLAGYNLGGQAGWRIQPEEIERLLAARQGKRGRT